MESRTLANKTEQERQQMNKRLEEIREMLAAQEHERWSRWMKYLFSKCYGLDKAMVIPAESVEHWQRQIDTPYAKMSEEEKDSDRKEADNTLRLIEAHLPGYAAVDKSVNGFDKYLDFQYRRSGSFYKNLFEAIHIADVNNLKKLAVGFPAEVEAYKVWARGGGAEEFIKHVSPNHGLLKSLAEEYGLEDKY